MQSLKKLTCGWEITWGIWQIFIRTLESVKIGTFMADFGPGYKIHELKIYRRVICNDTKGWWKIWSGIDLLFQNWHKEFDEFWFENLKVSKIYTLMGCFWPKYMFELKSTEELCLMVLNINTKFERKMTCIFKNDMRNFENFHQSTFESLKIGTFIGSFYTK